MRRGGNNHPRCCTNSAMESDVASPGGRAAAEEINQQPLGFPVIKLRRGKQYYIL